MKHIFYLVLLFILTNVTLINAQVPISLTYDGNDVTGSEITLERDVTMEIHVSNTGTSDMDIALEITDITTPHKAPLWEVCWGICLLPTGPIIFPDPVNVPAGTTNTEDFHVTYVSDGNTDPANITFRMYEDGVPGDYVTLVLDTEHVGINNFTNKELITIYPNPATTYFNINVSDEFTDGRIVITNIIGKIIKTIDLQRPENRFSTGELLKGMYFVSLIMDKKILTTKKLIVN